MDYREHQLFAERSPTGQALDEALTEAALGRGVLDIATAVACVPKEPLRKRELTAAVNCCRPSWRRYTDRWAPLPVLVMGGAALQALDGKAKAVGTLRGFIDDGWSFRDAHGQQRERSEVGEETPAGGRVGRGDAK